MPLLDGIHHLATLTADMDRLSACDARVFDAPVVADIDEEGLRHAFIQLGPTTLLHPFQIPGVEVPQGDLPIFGRGRIDHFALHAPTLDVFRELHHRAMSDGASTGEVTDLGPFLQFSLTDPDGVWLEVMWAKPGVPLDDSSSRRANWTTVDLDRYLGE